MKPTTQASVESRGRVSPTAPESKSISAIVWRGLESTPGFSEELHQAKADLEAGKGTPLAEVYRRGR